MDGSEKDEQTSRPHEPTTMRLPGINDLEQVFDDPQVRHRGLRVIVQRGRVLHRQHQALEVAG